MTRITTKQWLAVIVALPLLSALAGLPVAAWGPYSQAVIADRAADALGNPNGTEGPEYINSTSVAKSFEYSGRAYAKLDPAFTQTMFKIGGAGPALPQVLGWGSTQVAEYFGDRNLFYKAQHPYDRWMLELMVDASLMNSTSEPGTGNILETLGVSCRPTLLAGTSKNYCSERSGVAPFSAQYALQRAEKQALAMLAERVIMADEDFQANASEAAPAAWFEDAVNASVSAVMEHLAFGTLIEPEPADEISTNVVDYPIQLLAKLGSVLSAHNDAVISLTFADGVASYKIDVVTGRCNEIARVFLTDVSKNEEEHPTIRQLARMLLDAMTPEFGPRSFIDY